MPMSVINAKNSAFTKRINSQGFSLLEMIIAIFIFSLIITTVVATFIKVIEMRGKVKTVQQHTESARVAIEEMAKILRTSAIMSDDGIDTNIEVFDYSQEKCIRYNYDNGNKKLQVEVVSPATPLTPSTCSFSNIYTDMTGPYIGGFSFYSIKSDAAAKTRGRVTMVAKVCNTVGCSGLDKVHIQTTVSLRDY
jgi:prepilin-type N-terminal cleavage/methylation domain-containing protein